jgi:hypothetical protein
MTINETRDRAAGTEAFDREDEAEIAEETRSAAGRAKVAVMGVIERFPDVVSNARSGVSQVADRMPEAVGRARVAAFETETTLQSMDDSTLRLVASATMGLAAGLYLAGAKRLVTLAVLGGALVVGSAIATRPARRAVLAP